MPPPLRLATVATVALLATATALADAGAGGPQPFSMADLHRVRDVSGPLVSPDGQWVVYQVAEHDPKADTTSRRLWVAHLDGSARHALPSPRPQWAPTWGADSSLYALRDGGEGAEAGPQVWRLSLDGGPATQLTRLPDGVDEFALSPDGRQLAVIVGDPAPKTPEGATEPPVVTERFQFIDSDGGQFQTDRRHHLALVDLASGTVRALTSGPHDEASPAWSPDGRRIAYVSKRGPDPDRHATFHLFAIGVAPGAVEQALTDGPRSDADPAWGSRPAWSPDGTRIAFLQGGDPRWLGYAPTQLAVLDLATRGVTHPAPADRSFSSPAWSADGQRLYALREDAEASRVLRVDLAGGAVEALTPPARNDAAFALAPGDRLVVATAGTQAPTELFAMDGATLRPLSRANDEWLEGVRRQPVKDLVVTGRDGVELHAMWMPPVGAPAGTPVRTVVQLHGGPVAQFGHAFMADWQWFAAQGWGVLAINPRGSSGRGLDFARAIQADWGRLDGQDVLDVVDAAVARGLVDPRRLAIGGHSYGAMLADYVIASDRRFRAASVSAGTGNQLAMYGADLYARDDELELGTPWRQPDTWTKLSFPFLHADRIVTPTVFFCATEDLTVPCIGSQQMYLALRSQGVPARLVRFPHQGHELDVPSYIEFRLRATLEWFERFDRTR